MKKILFIILSLAFVSLNAQNLQLHYDFGRNIYSDQEAGRQKVTATFEQFKADDYGNFFYFIDLDLFHNGMAGAYTEFSREFNVGKKGFAAHFEYDGGLCSFHNSAYSAKFQHAALIGPAYNWASGDFSKTFSVQALYKQYFKGEGAGAYASVQLTGVWGMDLAGGKCRFSGFIDFWRGEKGNGHGQLVVLSEPQFWYNFNSHASLGTEFEISNNFVTNLYDDKSFFINPTLAFKWNF